MKGIIIAGDVSEKTVTIKVDSVSGIKIGEEVNIIRASAHNSYYAKCQDYIIRKGIKQCRDCGKPL